MFLKKWLDQNVLSLNISRTKFMPISLRDSTEYYLQDLIIHSCGSFLNTKCSCESIEKVSCYKYLGVVFDNRIKWKSHIECLITKLRKYIYAFRQLREVLTGKEIKLAYYAYVQSLLSFGIIVWGGSFSTVLEPLFIIQKLIIKTTFKKPLSHPTNSLFHEVAILGVRQLYIKTLLTHIYINFDTLFANITHPYNSRYSKITRNNCNKIK